MPKLIQIDLKGDYEEIEKLPQSPLGYFMSSNQYLCKKKDEVWFLSNITVQVSKAGNYKEYFYSVDDNYLNALGIDCLEEMYRIEE